MDEQESWTPAGDELVRGALATLRRDVEAVPLADVRFVKARGIRRRRSFAVGAVATAAAVAVVGILGLNALGSDRAVQKLGPATRTTTSIGPPVALAAPGPQLTAAEWHLALGIQTIRLDEMTTRPFLSECTRPPGSQLARTFVTSKQWLTATQGTYSADSTVAGDAAAAKVASHLVGCPDRGGHWKAEADAAWPKLFSNKANDGNHWLIVAHEGRLTSLIAVGEPAMSENPTKTSLHFTLAQIQAVAQVAQQRLMQEAGGDPVTAVPGPASGPQLMASEWQRALGTKAVQLGDMRPGEGVSTCLRPPGTQLAIGTATTGQSGFYGIQGTYLASSPDAGKTAAAKAVSQLLVCDQQPGQAGDHWRAEADATWPKVLSSSTASGKNWFIVAHEGALTSLLTLGDPALGGSTTETAHFSLAQIQALALAAQQRLVQEVDRGTAP